MKIPRYVPIPGDNTFFGERVDKLEEEDKILNGQVGPTKEESEALLEAEYYKQLERKTGE